MCRSAITTYAITPAINAAESSNGTRMPSLAGASWNGAPQPVIHKVSAMRTATSADATSVRPTGSLLILLNLDPDAAGALTIEQLLDDLLLDVVVEVVTTRLTPTSLSDDSEISTTRLPSWSRTPASTLLFPLPYPPVNAIFHTRARRSSSVSRSTSLVAISAVLVAHEPWNQRLEPQWTGQRLAGISHTEPLNRPQQMAGMPSACQLPVEYVISAWNLHVEPLRCPSCSR